MLNLTESTNLQSWRMSPAVNSLNTVNHKTRIAVVKVPGALVVPCDVGHDTFQIQSGSLHPPVVQTMTAVSGQERCGLEHTNLARKIFSDFVVILGFLNSLKIVMRRFLLQTNNFKCFTLFS